MSGRKPPGVTWETWIDRQIREGMERGEFERLPGHGKPIADIDQPHDELRWVRGKLRREGYSHLPPTLAVRKELDDTVDRIAVAGSEDEVRQLVAGINARIRRVNAVPTSGPPSTVAPLDVEDVVTRWRTRRG
ncbi:MAG TPA: DUF1992 domain-containing protein [Acidimicrobiales bacterium]|nr:DUF1992 domain-containing protein [Acidimicrobiales bacterium]